jgi:hypothetical protein
MPKLILHKDGAYNIYTTVSDGACYESALTLEQLEQVIRFEQGEEGVIGLPVRLERAHKTGCSALDGMTLEECISCNRSGPNEKELSLSEFVAKYLTLQNSALSQADAD